MRYIILLICFACANSFAESFKCELDQTGSFLKIEGDQKTGIASVLQWDPKSQGGYVEKVMFQRWPAIRGGVEITYCNPDDNEYTAYSQTYNIYSSCNSKPDNEPIGFSFAFVPKASGRIELLAAQGFSHTFRNCRAGQEWLLKPKFNYSSVPGKDFKKCMQTEIAKQAPYATEQKLNWIGFVIDQDILQTSYCIVDEGGYCKQAFTAALETSDPKGWQYDLSNAPKYVAFAANMGRYLKFKDHKTGAFELELDIKACASHFGIK